MSQLNTGQVGFYRVQYSSAMLELLLPAIRDNTLPPRDRLGLQSDLFALVNNKKKLSLIFFLEKALGDLRLCSHHSGKRLSRNENRVFLGVADDCIQKMTFCKRLKRHWTIPSLRTSSFGRSGGGAGKGRRASNYVSGIWFPPPILLWLLVDWAVRFPPISAKRKRARICPG